MEENWPDLQVLLLQLGSAKAELHSRGELKTRPWADGRCWAGDPKRGLISLLPYPSLLLLIQLEGNEKQRLGCESGEWVGKVDGPRFRGAWFTCFSSFCWVRLEAGQSTQTRLRNWERENFWRWGRDWTRLETKRRMEDTGGEWIRRVSGKFGGR